jgi:hypothetical protein
MTSVETIADRCEIEVLRAEFTDAGLMRDYDRFASLFTPDGVWRIPGVADFVSREEIRAGIERLHSIWDYFIQNVHAGITRLEGDTARGRTYVSEFGCLRDGGSVLNHSVYHDRYQRISDGWKFRERVYEVLYLDLTPLTGSAPPTAGGRD